MSSRVCKKVIKSFVFEDIFYSEDKQNTEEYVANSIEIINNRLNKYSFQFEYYITKVNALDSFKISKSCK